MTTITTGTQSTHNCCAPHDTVKPATPTVATGVAFDRVKDLTWAPNNAGRGGGWSRRPDPAYFELHNVEAGARVEIINLSKNPEASFSNNKDISELKPTGRDIRNRQLGIYLNNDQMTAIDLKAGDQLALRVIDPQGNASDPVKFELEPNDWASRDVQVRTNNRWIGIRGRGGQFDFLDGEGARKRLVVQGVADGRVPLLLDKKVSLDTVDFSDAEAAAAKCLYDNRQAIGQAMPDAQFTLNQLRELACSDAVSTEIQDAAKKLAKPALFDRLDKAHSGDDKVTWQDLSIAAAGKTVFIAADIAIEPHSRVDVFNSRTGKTHQVSVGEDQRFRLRLPDVAEGDTLIVRPFDNEGSAGAEIEMLYSSKCENGRAKTHNILGARLEGVI